MREQRRLSASRTTSPTTATRTWRDMAERPSALEAAAAEAGMEMDEAAGGEIGEVEAVAAAAAVRGGWPPTATQCCNMTNSCRMAAKQPPGPINLVYRVRIRFTGSDRI